MLLRLIIPVVILITACSTKPATKSRLPESRLSTLSGIPGPSLSTCPTAKCLTVLVAPWCGICHRVAPNIVTLRRYLDGIGISSRVVVGASSNLSDIKKFAAEFGPDSLLDDGGLLKARGVPQFLVSNAEGEILKSVDGFPNVRSVEELANALNLNTVNE